MTVLNATERLAEDAELLATAASIHTRQAAYIITAAGGLPRLAGLSIPEIAVMDGMTTARARRVFAAMAVGRRSMVPSAETWVGTPLELATLLLPDHGAYPVEHFGVVGLNTRNRVLGIRPIAKGTLDSTPVHPRDAFRVAIELHAASIVLFHNHPSGDPTPSADDRALTERFVLVGQDLGIPVTDHLILAGNIYYSFLQSGLMVRAA